MRVLLRTLGWIVGVFAALVVTVCCVIWFAFPRKIEVQPLQVARTEAAIERGRYLVENVAFCWSCHAQRDWTRYAGPVVEGTRGRGGSSEIFGDVDVFAPNITPFGIGSWSDGQVQRAIAAGLRADGTPLHPQMPYFTYRKMTQDDIAGVIAYLRGLRSIPYTPPQSSAPLWVRLVGKVLPKAYTPPDDIDMADSVERGLYLRRIADCAACHMPNMRGGFQLTLPSGESVVSPSVYAAVRRLTRSEFVQLFRARAKSGTATGNRPLSNTPMPWPAYAEMTDDDLAAIYDSLAGRIKLAAPKLEP